MASSDGSKLKPKRSKLRIQITHGKSLKEWQQKVKEFRNENPKEKSYDFTLTRVVHRQGYTDNQWRKALKQCRSSRSAGKFFDMLIECGFGNMNKDKWDRVRLVEQIMSSQPKAKQISRKPVNVVHNVQQPQSQHNSSQNPARNPMMQMLLGILTPFATFVANEQLSTVEEMLSPHNLFRFMASGNVSGCYRKGTKGRFFGKGTLSQTSLCQNVPSSLCENVPL